MPRPRIDQPYSSFTPSAAGRLGRNEGPKGSSKAADLLRTTGLGCMRPDTHLLLLLFHKHTQDHITPEELAELEAAEGWVDMLAQLEDLEDEHLIEIALR